MTTPENITTLKDNQVFVFGSNLNGNHAGGAAAIAKDKFGAQEGIGEGMTGQSYAFPTLDQAMQKVTIETLEASRGLLYKCAEANPEKQFLLTKVGCGIAGFTEAQIKKVFSGSSPKNIVMPAGWKLVRGYKAFEKGLVCRGFQYEFGKDFVHEGKIKLCHSGFHFCKSLSNVYSYYTFGTDIVVCEIESSGDVIDEDGEEKSVTNHLRIVRILNPEEASNNNGLGNLGHSNTGNRNTGDQNTGDQNTGNQNTGDQNTGYWNTGDQNTGNRNTGNRNTGNRNTGYWNTGYWNTGNRNTGDQNTGNQNTGYWNTGNRNTGYQNTGNRNTGNQNTGDQNTGDQNTGDQNTGNRNTGNQNTGYWNTGDHHVGSFNTQDADEVLVFNRPCSRKVWEAANKPKCLYFETRVWVDFSDMSDEEKKAFPSCKTVGGYVKDIPYKEAFTKSMEGASASELKNIKELPNFNADVFEEISGFRIK